MYTYRRSFLLERIREKWPQRAQLTSSHRRRDELTKWLQPTLVRFDNISPHFSKVRGFNDEGEALISLYTKFAFFGHQNYEHSSHGWKRVKDHHNSDIEKGQRTSDQEDILAPKRTRLRPSAVSSNDAARRFSRE